MSKHNPRAISDQQSDPFAERRKQLTRSGLQLLGGRFRFSSNSPDLLNLVDEAYQGLPKHRFSARPPRFEVTLHLSQDLARKTRGDAPPALSMCSGADILAGASSGASFASLVPSRRTALLTVSPSFLRFPYHTRYELIEFAVFTLASRTQKLVPLHSACVGIGGRGILLMGESGAGKSTLSLQCLLDGFQFLAEDSVFVEPRKMLATGTANYLHVRADTLDWFDPSPQLSAIRGSPTIRRRSGVEKFEVNLRNGQFLLAPKPLKLSAVVFLSTRSAKGSPLLNALSKREISRRLRCEQAYGASLPQWRDFERGLLKTGGFELRRGAHPRESADELRRLIESR